MIASVLFLACLGNDCEPIRVRAEAMGEVILVPEESHHG